MDRSGNFKGNRNKFNLGQYYASGRMPPPKKPAMPHAHPGQVEADAEERGDDGDGVGLGEMFDADDY